MKIHLWLNGKEISDEISPDMPLLEYVRTKGCYSVKRGCETSNCGLCTVWMNKKPVLSCSVLAARADGKEIVTLEGVQERAAEFGTYLANQGGEQCGFCNPGFIMNVLAMNWTIRPRRRSRHIFPEISAAAAAMRASCVRSKIT